MPVRSGRIGRPETSSSEGRQFGHAELIENWRAELVDLVQDLAVVEGALVELEGELVDKAQSLRWIERTRARLVELAERMAAEHIEKPEGSLST